MNMLKTDFPNLALLALPWFWLVFCILQLLPVLRQQSCKALKITPEIEGGRLRNSMPISTASRP